MDKERLHLLRELGAAFFCIQGTFCLVWWALLISTPIVRSWFLWEGMPDGVLYAFFPGDMCFYGVLSLALAFGFSTRAPWIVRGSLVMTGAASYAAFMTVGLFLFSESGGAASILLMLVSCVGTATFTKVADRLLDEGCLA